MKTRSIKIKEVTEKWYIVDAKGVRLGKLASFVAGLLIGKDLVIQVGYLVPQNKVIVTNSKLVDIHPRKALRKVYTRYSGYPGGLKEIPYARMQKDQPNTIIEKAVSGMLPKTTMRKKIMNNLFVYEGDTHKQEAQKPITVTLD